MVALRRLDRLCEIYLHVTISMLVQVTQKPCQALESIRITVETPTGPSIPVRNAFLGGSAPHLREIKLDGVPSPFPAIRKSFHTRNLIELHLSNIPDDVYFLPNDGPAQTAYGRIPFPCFFPTSKYDASTSSTHYSPLPHVP